MNVKVLVSACVLAFASQAYSASYVLNNGAGATASGIQDSLGQTFRSGTTAGVAFPAGGGTSGGPGVVAVGIFTTADGSLNGLSNAALVASFQQFGSSNSFAAAGPTGNRSVFSLSTAGTITGSQFDGQAIYLIAGNGTTLANSTEFVVIKSTLTFTGTDDSNPNPITLTSITTANSSVLVGTQIANVQTANTDGSTTAGWQMRAVPEPSAALLGALGALGLLRRRR